MKIFRRNVNSNVGVTAAAAPPVLGSDGGLGRFNDILARVVASPAEAAKGFKNSIRYIEDNLGDKNSAAEIIHNTLSNKVKGYDWDEVVPLVPNDSSKLGGAAEPYTSLMPDEINNILAGSLLGQERKVLNNTLAQTGIGIGALTPGQMRQNFVANLQNSLSKTGYNSNFNSLYPDYIGSTVLSNLTPPIIASALASPPEYAPANYETSLGNLEIKQILNAVLDSNLPEDNVIDDRTTDHVKIFQNLFGLVPDGTVGPETTSAMVSLIGKPKKGR